MLPPWGRSQLGTLALSCGHSTDGRIQVKTFVGRSTLGALGGVFTVLISALVIRMGAHQDIGPRLAELFVPSLTMMALSAPSSYPLHLIEGLVSPRIEIDRI